MKKMFLTAIGCIVPWTAPALAADVPAPIYTKVTGQVATVSNWGGFYVGAQFGGQNVAGQSISTFGVSNINSVNNVLGGVLAGYNWQTGSFVYGIEGDWSVIDTSPSYHPNLFTLRGRAGWAHDNMLFYVTAGAATKNDYQYRYIISGGMPMTIGTEFHQSLGPVAGGGVEIKLPYQFSVRGEGLYYLDNHNYDYAAIAVNGRTFPAVTFDTKSQHFVYRASLIYNFK